MDNIYFHSLIDAIHIDKDNGTSVDYYLFDEYEIHFNLIAPHTKQEWHYHTQIMETIMVIKGRLLCHYMEDDIHKNKYLFPKDLVQIGKSIHTFENDMDNEVEFIVFRFVPDGVNKREIIKNDKKIVRL